MNRNLYVLTLLAGAHAIELKFGFGDIGGLTSGVMDLGSTVVPGEAGEFLATSSETTSGLIDAGVSGDVTGIVDASGTLGA